MPIYEYACARCESEFEVEQRITEEPLKTCPRCRSRRIKRLISQTSFALKGGGWYADGYSGNGSSKSAGGSSSGGGSGAAPASEGTSSGSTSGSEKKGPKETGEKAVA